MIEKLVSLLIKKVEANELTDAQMMKIAEIYKKHKLSDEETVWAKECFAKIKSGELTKQMLIDEARKWLEENTWMRI